MKKTFKFLSFLLLLSTLAIANCSKYSTGGSMTNGAVVASYVNSLVRSAVTGNCAISLNLGSLYAGAILQGAVGNTTIFPQASYEAASGTTVTTQGYTNYASVPYNRKYDAFLTNTTSWTATTRNTALASQKAQVDSYALIGAVFTITSGGATINTTTQAAVSAFYATFGTAEKTAMVTTTTGVNTLSSLLGITSVTALDSTITTTSGSNLLGALATLAPTIGGSSAGAGQITAAHYLYRSSWRSGLALMGCSRIPRSSCTLGAISTATQVADITGQAGVANTLINTSECRKNSSSTLSPTRILTTLFAGLSKDRVVTEGGFTYQNSTLNPDGSSSSLTTVYGATEGGQPSTITGAFNTWTTTNPIIASSAYPKSGALTSLGFSTAFPLTSGTTAYGVTTGTAVPTSQTAQTDASAATTTTTIPWYGGSNINLNTVTSCESIGLGTVGPTPLTGAVGGTNLGTATLPAMNTSQVDSPTSGANRKPLTDVKEIIYAFSSANTAATVYATLSGVAYTNATGGVNPVTTTVTTQQGFDDALACNTAMRKTVTISSTLGVGTSLASINTAYGDGNASALLTTCIYGGTSSSRTTAAAILGASLSNITSCPASAISGAAAFGEYGLTSLTSNTTTANSVGSIDGKP